MSTNPQYLQLALYRGIADLKSEASRNYLGIAWWFLEPILYTIVFYFVFAVGFRAGGEDRVAFLLCGLTVWKWLDSSVRNASMSIFVSSGLIGQVYFPKYILPVSVVLSNAFKFLIILTILCIYLFWQGYPPSAEWLWLPFLLLATLLLILAMSLLSAALVPLLPDLKFVINYGMTMLFFMSGIFFDIHAMAPELQEILVFNPIVSIVDGFRAVLVLGQAPNLAALTIIGLLAALVAGFALRMLAAYDRVYPKLVR